MTDDMERETEPQSQADHRIETLLNAFKALADLSRLRILGAVATQERTVEELAEMLELKAPTVSHHLTRLRDLGLIQTRADGVTRWNRLDQSGLERLAKRLAAPQVVAVAAADVASMTGDRKILRDYLDESEPSRLREIPAQRKKRQVILRWLAEQFEWGRIYSEKEVNAILKRRHDDTATLRRELIGERLMARDSGHYWRSEPPTEETLARVERRLEWGRVYSLAELTMAIREVSHDADTIRRELLSRGVLSFTKDSERYWLARPPEEKLR